MSGYLGNACEFASVGKGQNGLFGNGSATILFDDIIVYNDTGRTVGLMWFGDRDYIPIAAGLNRVKLPHHQQMEKAKFGYDIQMPRPRMRWCPWTILEMGAQYRLQEIGGDIVAKKFGKAHWPQ